MSAALLQQKSTLRTPHRASRCGAAVCDSGVGGAKTSQRCYTCAPSHPHTALRGRKPQHRARKAGSAARTGALALLRSRMYVSGHPAAVLGHCPALADHGEYPPAPPPTETSAAARAVPRPARAVPAYDRACAQTVPHTRRHARQNRYAMSRIKGRLAPCFSNNPPRSTENTAQHTRYTTKTHRRTQFGSPP